jgi:CheY-like chemotaxis protein
VRSTVGVGTAFTVELPLRRDVDTRVPDVAGAVLVVDDDETARYVVEAHLRDTAWRTVTVAGGEAALAALAQELPAAIILDLSMPDLDGLEVLRRMRADARMATVPVIIHTSRLLSRDEAERLEALGAHLLDKSSTSRSQLLEVLSIATRATR